MNSAEQVVFVLELLLVLGPLAVYFLCLGLVNSLAHPCLVNARVDFVLLATAFVPVLLAPLVFLLQNGLPGLALVVLAVVIAIFWAMLPDARSRWVIYNCSLPQFRRLLTQSTRRLGWTIDHADERVHILPAGLDLQIHAIPWLRNVTFHISSESDSAATQRLLCVLKEEMAAEGLLPSPTGASLVLIGAALLGVPMWYLLHHMGAIVDVVRQILFA